MFPRPRLQSLEWYQEVLLLREACDQEIHKLIPDGYESDVNQNRNWKKTYIDYILPSYNNHSLIIWIHTVQKAQR